MMSVTVTKQRTKRNTAQSASDVVRFALFLGNEKNFVYNTFESLVVVLLIIITGYKIAEYLRLAFSLLQHSIMRSSCSCLVLAAVFQVICCQIPRNKNIKMPRELQDLGIFHPYQQKIPRHCWQAPRDIDLHKCCPIPNLYSDEVMDLCEIEKTSDNGTDIPTRPKVPKKAACQDGKCLMQNSNLLMKDGSINYDELRTYIDDWAAANPEFTEAIMIAKPLCAKEKGKDWHRGQPPNICDQDRVFMCLKSHILWNCKLKEFEECHRLREHMDECRPYHLKPKKAEENTTTKNE